MSWKSIEMQVALPRTQDAGKLQDQIQKQNQHFQESLANSQLKENDLKRNKVQNSEHVQGNGINNKQENGTHDNQSGKEDSRQTKEEYTTEHPYLGKKIDFKG